MYFSKTKLVIDDSILWQNARETEFGNFINGRTALYERKTMPPHWDEHLGRNLYDQQILLSNESETYERVRIKFIASVADLGGLYALLTAIFASFYWLLAEPFRNLHLAVSFN